MAVSPNCVNIIRVFSVFLIRPYNMSLTSGLLACYTQGSPTLRKSAISIYVFFACVCDSLLPLSKLLDFAVSDCSMYDL